ncbi:MAG: serine hydrolase [Proteobacteria bacterium]|nr:serine hydrolase [Pseudomonadota bacterium]
MTRDNGNVAPAVCNRLAQSLAGLSEECVLRVRRGSTWWEGSNRDMPEGVVTASAGPLTRAFRTASVTKTFTATVTLRLAEEGRVALDAGLSTYLPGEICERIHILEGISYGSRITIDQLLSHRSGIFDYATDPRFFAQVAAAPNRRWSPLDLLNEALNDRKPYFRPGEGLAYSDTGYVLLAMIIESVTGSSLASAYRKHLLDPLALEHTYLEGREPPVNWPVSHAYAGAVDTFGLDPSFDTFGGVGLVSTAADLDRFISNLLGGSVFAARDTLRLMMEGTDAPPGSGTRKTRSAAGLSEFSIAGKPFWGHLGHWNSFMLHSIVDDISICGTFNQAEEDPRHKSILEAAVIEASSWQG